jgi:hypothetical protein
VFKEECPITLYRTTTNESRSTKYRSKKHRTRMIYFDKPFFAVQYNPALRCAIHHCKGYFFREEYQAALKGCLEVVIETGATSLIINMQALRDEESWDAGWTGAEWFPQILQTDVRKMAIIIPHTALPHLLRQCVEFTVADEVFVGRFFDSTHEAIHWIKHFH